VFRIDKHYLTRGSRHFTTILNPVDPPRDRPGSSESNPFVLDDATSEGFASLLWVFYNADFSYDAPLKKWEQILTLARQWGMARVERLCIRELQKLDIDPIKKIELYQSFQLNPNLLHSSFVDLVIRPRPLSIEEGERLTLPTSMKLAEARERARDPDMSITLEELDVKPVIEDVFGLQGGTPPSTTTSPQTTSPQKEIPTTDDHVNNRRNNNRGSRPRMSISLNDMSRFQFSDKE
jgi:hypothetical protein